MDASLPNLLAALEANSRDRPDRVLRLRGRFAQEPLEVLIFRGFSSSTTHATAFDPDQPLLADGAVIETAELLLAPLNPSAEQRLAGPASPDLFRDPGCWG